MGKGKFSLRTRLRLLFDKGLRFTVDDLCHLTEANAESIRSTIATIKHPIYSGSYGAMQLNQTQSPKDHKKRWGTPTAEGNYEPGMEDGWEI